MTWSFIAWFLEVPDWMVWNLPNIEREIRGVDFDYDHWQEVWALQQQLPPDGTMRVGYLPYDLFGRHQLGLVKV